MIPTQELLLVLAAFGLYAADATRLLFADELVFEKRGRRWVAHDGAPFLLAGRRPLVPRLLRPGSPLLLVSVHRLASQEPEATRDGGRFLAALRPLGWHVSALFLLFFPGLPLVLRAFGGGVELLAWLVAIYGVVGSMALLAWRHQEVLGLRRRAWLALVLECALCPPLAINLIRKLGMRADLLGLRNAGQVLGPEGRAQLVAAATHRIDEMLAELGPEAPGAARLAERRRHLQAQAPGDSRRR